MLYSDRQTPIQRPLFQGNLGKPAPERLNQSGLQWSKRWWDGNGISWTICRSFAPHSRQITTPAPHHSIFYRPDALPDAQLCQSTEGKYVVQRYWSKVQIQACVSSTQCFIVQGTSSWTSRSISRNLDNFWSSCTLRPVFTVYCTTGTWVNEA